MNYDRVWMTCDRCTAGGDGYRYEDGSEMPPNGWTVIDYPTELRRDRMLVCPKHRVLVTEEVVA